MNDSYKERKPETEMLCMNLEYQIIFLLFPNPFWEEYVYSFEYICKCLYDIHCSYLHTFFRAYLDGALSEVHWHIKAAPCPTNLKTRQKSSDQVCTTPCRHHFSDLFIICHSAEYPRAVPSLFTSQRKTFTSHTLQR